MIVGLEAITRPELPVTVYSDSKYVVDAVEKRWVFGWQKKGFGKKANDDLWPASCAYTKHKVSFVWISGHAGHPENERCDELAVQAPSPLTCPSTKASNPAPHNRGSG